MSVYKPKKSPIYQFDFWVKGHRHHGSTGTASYEEAKAVEAAEREKARKSAMFPDEQAKPQMALDIAFQRYYEEVAQHQSSGENVLNYMQNLLALGGDTLLSDLTDSAIAKMVAKRRGQKARYSDNLVSNATVNRETEILRQTYHRSRDLWNVDVGTEPKWSRHMLPEADERVRELTSEEEARLFTALREDYHPMVRFAMTSGLRLQNVIRLTWKQVDQAAGKITVKTKSRKPGGKVHTLPISPAMRVLLANERGHHPIFVFTYLCQRNRDKSMGTKRIAGQRYPFSEDGWRRAWANALADAGIEDFRFHDLRHTAATRIVRATGSIKIAQKMLGHTSLMSTARYAHVTQDDVLDAMKKVDFDAESRKSPEMGGADIAESGSKTKEKRG